MTAAASYPVLIEVEPDMGERKRLTVALRIIPRSGAGAWRPGRAGTASTRAEALPIPDQPPLPKRESAPSQRRRRAPFSLKRERPRR